MEARQNKFKQYISYIMLIILLMVLFLFRDFFVNVYLNLKYKFFFTEPVETLNLTEREELSILRAQNKILADENTQLKNEFGVGIIDETKSPVYLLLRNSTLYGDFYVTLPKSKTVYIGMNIYSNGNILIGTVSEIGENYLKVESLGRNKSFIGTVLDTDETIEFKSLSSGLYVGESPGGSTIELGDEIILKGFPKSIIGTVVEISKEEAALSNIFVRTPYNTQTKEIFYVLQ